MENQKRAVDLNRDMVERGFSPNLDRDQVKALHKDANKLIEKNNKRYSIVTTSSIVRDESVLKKTHRPADGFITVPPEVARKMGNHSGSKFIRGQQVNNFARSKKPGKKAIARQQAQIKRDMARVSEIRQKITQQTKGDK